MTSPIRPWQAPWFAHPATVEWFAAVEHMARYCALPAGLPDDVEQAIAADLPEFHRCVRVARAAHTWTAQQEA